LKLKQELYISLERKSDGKLGKLGLVSRKLLGKTWSTSHEKDSYHE